MIVLIADLHGNRAAFDAICADVTRRGFQIIDGPLRDDLAEHEALPVFLGDLVDPLPESAEIAREIREHGWTALRGNHEDYILAARGLYGGTDALFSSVLGPGWRFQPVRLCAERFDAETLRWMAKLPEHISQGEVLFLHAGLRSNRRGDFRGLRMRSERLVVGGHFHDPRVIPWGEKRLAFLGSAGIPLRAEPAAARCDYALLQSANEAEIELIEVEYDAEATAALYEKSGDVVAGGAVASLVLHELRTRRRSVGPFFRWLRAKPQVDVPVDIEAQSAEWANEQVTAYLKEITV